MTTIQQMDGITIFLLIGGGHWASHLLKCRGCQESIADMGKTLLEGIMHVLGWPCFFAYAFAQLIMNHLKPLPKDPAIEKFFEKTLKEFKEAVPFKINMSRDPNESDDAFHARIGRQLTGVHQQAESKTAEKEFDA